MNISRQNLKSKKMAVIQGSNLPVKHAKAWGVKGTVQ
jgi:hypothetical protein